MAKFILLFSVLFFTNVESKESTTETNLFSKERHGIRLYRKGNYEKAYEKLYTTAQWGLKDSQYFIALMFLKGQFVKQDIIKGMGYLGVANEAPIKDRIKLFEKVYAELPKDIKILVDKRVNEYIEIIGLKAKSIKCSNSKDVGSRVNVIDCSFYKANIGSGEVD